MDCAAASFAEWLRGAAGDEGAGSKCQEQGRAGGCEGAHGLNGHQQRARVFVVPADATAHAQLCAVNPTQGGRKSMQGQRARSPMINRANFTDWLNEHYAKLQQDSLTKLPRYVPPPPWRVVADVHTPTCMRALPVHIHAAGMACA